MSEKNFRAIQVAKLHEQGWRDYQEDHLGHIQLGPLQIFVVSDGMGGLSAGDVASNAVVRTVLAFLKEHFLRCNTYEDRNRVMKQAILSALHTLQSVGGNRRMGATVVVAAVHAGEGWIGVSWVGDSRAYLAVKGSQPPQTHSDRIASGKGITRIPIPMAASKIAGNPWSLWLLTRDHSFVWRTLVDSGEFAPEYVREHPMKNRLNLALSTQTSEQELMDALRYHEFHIDHSEGVLLLCSDGVWESLSSEELLQILALHHREPEQAAVRLRRQVEAYQHAMQGGDNFTAWIVSLQEAAIPEKTASERNASSMPQKLLSTVAPALASPITRSTRQIRTRLKTKYPARHMLIAAGMGIGFLVILSAGVFLSRIKRGYPCPKGKLVQVITPSQTCTICGEVRNNVWRVFSSFACEHMKPDSSVVMELGVGKDLESMLKKRAYVCSVITRNVGEEDSVFVLDRGVVVKRAKQDMLLFFPCSVKKIHEPSRPQNNSQKAKASSPKNRKKTTPSRSKNAVVNGLTIDQSCRVFDLSALCGGVLDSVCVDPVLKRGEKKRLKLPIQKRPRDSTEVRVLREGDMLRCESIGEELGGL